MIRNNIGSDSTRLNRIKIWLIAALFAILLGTTGCTDSVPESPIIQESNVNNQDFDEATDNSEPKAESTEISQPEEVSEEENLLSTDLSSIPDYSGRPYVVINGGVPYFSEEDKTSLEAFEEYSPLDKLGRCGVAYANICIELMPTEERGSIGQIKPSGWHTVKYNDLIDGNYLYNRCHLIGYQLAGENANELNLITGTRYLNMEGMLPFENEVADYVQKTENHVLYRVTPIFENNNLVASGVLIEAWSVEDKGTGICINAFCYNNQPGIVIDYLTGESTVDTSDGVSENGSEEQIQDEFDPNNGDSENITYIVNKNTKKFHLPSCSSVSTIAEHNLMIYEGNYDDLISMGYKPCKRCLDK